MILMYYLIVLKVSGLPNKNGDRHAVEIANCAMDLLSGILNFKVSHMPEDYVLRLRIGRNIIIFNIYQCIPGYII